MRNGFTLVELSIVLVIIGLLIGGILVGQSLIESAKMNKLVSNFKQYEVAANQYKTKFKSWPGDTPSSTGFFSGNCSVNCYGNADGISNEASSAFRFVHHLQWLGMIKTNFSTTVDMTSYETYASMSGKVIPNFGVDKAGVVADTSSHNLSTEVPYCRVALRMGQSDLTTPLNYPWRDFFRGGIFDGQDSFALDKKIDDGKPNSGYLLTIAHTNQCNSGSGGTSYFKYGGTASYNSNSTQTDCLVWYCLK